ncbi:MAG: ATP-binding cassette domain-containing protein [Kiritimatiellae bacterium]|nr:ATP-binding cassette domain-containing protein [Kiritimatiellia bacterium]
MLELKNVTFALGGEGAAGGREIVRDVSLAVPDGRTVVVTGPNGGGKSTLARLVAGIEIPTSGTITLDGEDITRATITERARKGIGFAFQQPVRFKGLRVLDLLAIAAGRTLTTSEACDYLVAVGLCAKDYIRREVNASLSGGELKRIEIATVFAKASKVSIFDEPEAGIDLWSFQNLIEAFKTMRRTVKGGSIIIISHQERILAIADDIVVVKDGAIARQGPKAEIFPSLIGTAMVAPGCPKFGIAPAGAAGKGDGANAQ